MKNGHFGSHHMYQYHLHEVHVVEGNVVEVCVLQHGGALQIVGSIDQSQNLSIEKFCTTVRLKNQLRYG